MLTRTVRAVTGLLRTEFPAVAFSGLYGCMRRRSSSNQPVDIRKYRKLICSSKSLSGWTSVVNSPVPSLDRVSGRNRPPPQTSSLSPARQHLQYKHLFFNIDELQLQIQLLHLGCHCILLLTVTGRKSKDSAITPETTQTHSHTHLPAWRTAEQHVTSTQNFECSMTVLHRRHDAEA